MDPISKAEVQARAPKMIRATVARGRSIEMPTGEKVQTGYNLETKENCYAQKCEVFKEFSEVDLPEDEVIRLRALGYLIDPNAKAPQQVAGAVSQEKGQPSVTHYPPQ